MGVVRCEVWALPQGGEAVQLPDLKGWELAPSDAGDWGSVKIDYPVDGLRYELLADLADDERDLEIEIALTAADDEGAPRQRLYRGFLLDLDTDDVADTGTATVTGALIEYLLGEVVVPYAPGAENGETALDGTAGKIMRLLLTAAQARGCLAGVTWTFTDTHDSNGQPWARTASVRFSPGQHYAAVLGTLRGYQLSAWELTYDRVLRLVNPDGKGVDRSVGPGALVLEYGADLADAPRKFSLRGAITSLITSGKDGIYSSASDATARARRGRRIEGYRSFGNAATQGTLDALTSARLGTMTAGTTAVSHQLILDAGGPLPLFDFGVSDWLLSATRRGVARRRVVQITMSGTGDEASSAAVDLGTVVDEAVLDQARRLDALENGTTVVGTSTPPPDSDDGSFPDQVSTPSVTSLWYSTGEGVGLSSVLAGWSPIPDARIVGYVVEWRYGAEPLPPESATSAEKAEAAALIRVRMLSGQPIAEDWTWAGAPAVVGKWNDVLLDEWVAAGRPTAVTWLGTYQPAQSSSGWRRTALVEDTATSWGGVNAGATVRVRVAAQNRWGRLGPWSTVVEIVTETDGAPPPVASAPAPYIALGLFVIPWNGRGAVGEAMPGDFLRAEVHLSAVNGFTPHRPLYSTGRLNEAASSTYVGELRGGGELVVDLPPAAYGTTYYARFVLVDRSHNAAVAGAQGSAVAAGVKDGEIAELNVSKLRTGILTALVTVAGRLYGGDPLGNGWEADAAGFRFWSGTGSARATILEFVQASASLLITGTVQSGRTGRRVVLSGAGNDLRFMPAQGETRVGRVYSYVPANYPSDVAIDVAASNAAELDVTTRLSVLPHFAQLGVQDQGDNTRSWSRFFVSKTAAKVEVYSSPGALSADLSLDTGLNELSTRRVNGDKSTWIYGYDPGQTSGLTCLMRAGHTSDGQRGEVSITQAGYSFVGTAAQDGRKWGVEYSGSNALLNLRTAGSVQVVNEAISAWRPVKASAFEVQCSAEVKEQFEALPGSALDALRGSPITSYRRNGDPDGVRQIGPVAEDLPAWLLRERTGPTMRTMSRPGPDREVVDETTGEVRVEAGPEEFVEVPADLPDSERIDLVSYAATIAQALRELDAEFDEFRRSRGRPVPRRRLVGDLLDDVRRGRIGRRDKEG